MLHCVFVVAVVGGGARGHGCVTRRWPSSTTRAGEYFSDFLRNYFYRTTLYCIHAIPPPRPPSTLQTSSANSKTAAGFPVRASSARLSRLDDRRLAARRDLIYTQQAAVAAAADTPSLAARPFFHHTTTTIAAAAVDDTSSSPSVGDFIFRTRFSKTHRIAPRHRPRPPTAAAAAGPTDHAAATAAAAFAGCTGPMHSSREGQIPLEKNIYYLYIQKKKKIETK